MAILGLVSREAVKKKWRKLISNEMWETLGSNDELVDRIEAEKVRRVRDGSAKREKLNNTSSPRTTS